MELLIVLGFAVVVGLAARHLLTKRHDTIKDAAKSAIDLPPDTDKK